MSRTIIAQSALTPNELQQQQTELLLLNGDRADHKLMAQWQLDEHSKLYCKWVMA